MGRKTQPNITSNNAIKLFQAHLSKPENQFPRAPDVWANKAPTHCTDGMDLSEEQFAKALLNYEEGLRSHDDKFNPEKYYVLSYLAGGLTSDQAAYKYFGPINEMLGRILLVELLKSDTPIPRDVRRALATLISPNRNGSQESEREFAIRFRKKGNRQNLHREVQVCEVIAATLRKGKQLKVAVLDAMKEHSLGRSEVLKIWQLHRGAYLQMGMIVERRVRGKRS